MEKNCVKRFTAVCFYVIIIVTRKKLKQISSVKDFESLIEQTMLSEEEKKILWLHYKEQKTMAFIADELGMSEITVKKKHSKMLMKIGKMF